MADLSDLLSGLLNSPDGMQKLQAAASSLGLGGANASESPEPSPPAEAEPSADPPAGDGGLDLSMIMKLMPLVTDFQQDDENTVLLKALRPYLQNERQERLDQSMKIIRLLKLLPLLGSGGGLF